MTRDEIVTLVDRWMDGFSRHDAAALASLYSEDCVVESPMAGTVQGRAANAQVFRAFFEAFPDVSINVDDLLIDGDRVVQVGVLSGTDTGGLMGMVPSGKPAFVPIVHVFRLEENRIVGERRIYDFTGLLVQIGVLKARPA